MYDFKPKMLSLVFWLFGSIFIISAARAEAPSLPSSPKWEVGLGFGGQDLPHYRGSDQRHNEVLPIPFVFYTGRYVKVNRDGARSEIVKRRRFELNLSADLALDADADSNRARAGMEALDTALELGPSFNILLLGDSFKNGWSLRLPIRAVTTVGAGLRLRSRGYVFNPRLTWRTANVWQNWKLSTSLGALWGSRSYHEYYYSVAPEHVTPNRTAYQAKSGFAGLYSKLSARKNMGSWLLGFSIRYDNLDGAVFEQSPLVKSKHYTVYSGAIAKTFWAF